MARPKSSGSSSKVGKEQPTVQDDNEWTALVSAFQVYKAAYGDLKVPSRFIVPSISPWPETAWGMKLGQRVAAIRSTGKYVEENVQRRKTLDELGFLWRLRAPSPDTGMADTTTFDQIYSALLTYKIEMLDKQETPPPLEETTDEHDYVDQDLDSFSSPFHIPRNFVVPSYAPWPEETRGLPLGKMLPAIRSKAFLKANPDAADKLQSLGFELDGKVAANEAKFALVYKALATYKQLYGDLLVPQPFVIPSQNKEWPQDTWGLRLGARVNAIRSQGTFVKNNPERKQILNELGFEWETSNNISKITSTTKKGRKRKELDADDDADLDYDSGDLDDRMFDEESPTLFAQYAGASKLPINRSDEESKKRKDRSDEEEVEDYDEDEDNLLGEDEEDLGLLLSSMAGTARDSKSNMDFDRMTSGIKDSPMIPPPRSDEEYQAPKNLNATLMAAAEMAKAVGVIESIGQGKRVVKGKINKKFPWSIDDFGEEFVFEDVVEALTLYKKITGSFAGLETKEFVVPDPYMKAVESIDVEASARAAARIKLARLRGEDSDALIAAEIQRMESELQSPSKEHEWPEHLAGMKLGAIVNRIRDGSLEVKHLPERKAQLDAIGFDWGDPRRFLDVPFEKAMCAMFAYFLIRGDLFVYEDFVIPHDEPWPSVLGGYPLGKFVRRIQELQHFFEAYHPEKVQLLRMVEFSWFPELALPLNPEAGEESWEDMYVDGVGHPFYHLNEPTTDMIESLQAQTSSNNLDGRAKSYYNYDVVKDYWKYGDLTDSGRAERDGRWNAADWLWWNGFNQLSREHEERHGPSPGLELVRLLEDFDEEKKTEFEFDEAALEVIKSYDLQELRSEAISAGIDVKEEDNWDTVMQKIMDDPGIIALDSDPEYQRMVQAEIEAEEARIRARMDNDVDDEEDDDDHTNEISIEEDDSNDDEPASSDEAYDESFSVLE